MTKKTSTITSPTAINDLFSQETLERASKEFEEYKIEAEEEVSSEDSEEAGIESLTVIPGFLVIVYFSNSVFEKKTICLPQIGLR